MTDGIQTSVEDIEDNTSITVKSVSANSYSPFDHGLSVPTSSLSQAAKSPAEATITIAAIAKFQIFLITLYL